MENQVSFCNLQGIKPDQLRSSEISKRKTAGASLQTPTQTKKNHWNDFYKILLEL